MPDHGKPLNIEVLGHAEHIGSVSFWLRSSPNHQYASSGKCEPDEPDFAGSRRIVMKSEAKFEGLAKHVGEVGFCL